MFVIWWRGVLAKVFNRKTTSRRRGRKRHQPSSFISSYRIWFEKLEDRWVPTSYNWTGATAGTGNSWIVGTNWTPTYNHTGAPMTSADSASILDSTNNNFTVNLNAAITIGALAVGDTAASGGNGNQNMTIAAGTGGSFTFDNGANPFTLTVTSVAGTGSVTISAGITLNSDLVIEQLGAHPLVLSGGINANGKSITVMGGGSGVVTFSGPLTNMTGSLAISSPATLNLSLSGTVTLGNTFSGDGTLGKFGAGTLALGDNYSAFTGSLTIGAGAARVDTASAISAVSSITVDSTAGLQLNVGASTTFSANLTLGTTTNATLQNLSGASTWNGNISFVGGGTKNIVNNDTSNTLLINGPISVAAGSITLTGSGNISVTGNITGNLPLIKNGTGTLTLSGNNSISAVTLSAGSLILSPSGTATYSGAISSAAATTLTIAGSGTTIFSGANTYTIPTNINAGATLQVGAGGTTGGITSSSAVANNGSLVFNRSNLITYSNPITGSGSITQAGTGTLHITSASNAYQGGTFLNSGTIHALANTNFGSTSEGLTFNGGTLHVNGAYTTTNRTFTLASGGGAINATSSFTVNGEFDVSGGGGVLSLPGAGTLNLGATNNTIGSLAGSAPLNLGANNLTLGTDGSAQSYTGVISGASATLTKVGTGTQSLSGVQTFGGGTTIDGGVLRINNPGSLDNVTVNSGGTLGGTGTVGSITVNSGGAVDPGSDSPGTLTITSDVDLSNGGILIVSVAGSGYVAGVDYDVLDLGPATLTLGGTSTLLVDLSGLASSGTAIGIALFGERIGTFNTVTLTSNYDFDVTYNANSIDIELETPTRFWIGNTTPETSDDLWSIGSNWAGGVAPGTGENVVFDSGVLTEASKTSTNDLSGLALIALAFADSGFNISGNAIDIADGITNETGTNTISLNTSFVAGNIWTVTAGTLTANNVISGTGSMTIAGAGTLVLTGASANTYTGATTVQDTATLVFDKGSGSGGVNAISGSLTISGGTVRFEQNSQMPTGTLTTVAAGTLDLNGNNQTLAATVAITLGGIVSGTPAVVQTGTGTLTLGGNVRYEGVSGTALGATISGNLNLGAATRTFSASQGLSAVDLTISATITGTGGLTKTGAGSTMRLTATNSSYSGLTTATNGTLQAVSIGNSGSNGSIGTNGTVVIGGAGIFEYVGPGETTNRSFSSDGGRLYASGTGLFTIASPGGLSRPNDPTTLGGTGHGRIDGLIAIGVGNLIKEGTGTWTITNNANTYTGATRVLAGTLEFTSVANRQGGGTALSSLGDLANASGGSTYNITLGPGATLRYIGSGTSSSNRPIVLSGDATLDASGSGTVSWTSVSPVAVIAGDNALTLTGTGSSSITGAMSGVAGGLTKTGSGTWTLSGTNTYGGSTTITAGTIVLGTNAPSGSNGALGNSTSTVLIGGTSANAGLLTNGAFTVGRNIEVVSGSTGTVALGGNTGAASTFSGAVALFSTATLTAASGGAVTFSGVVSETGGVVKSGAGTVLLTNTNTYEGGTTINAGTLEAASDANLGDGAGGLTFGGGTLRVTGSYSSTNRAVTLAPGGGTFNIANTGSAFTLNSAVGVTGSGGPLNLVTSGSTLTMNGANNTIGSLSGPGDLELGSNNLTLGTDGSAQSYTGIISGSTATLTKVGTGTQSLSGINTYGGGTTIDEGVLRILSPGSIGDVTVNADGTLGGTGTVGTITVNGGTIDPGTSPGILTTTDSLDLSNGGTLVINVTGTDFIVGDDYDRQVVGIGGTLTLTLGGTSTLVLDLAGLNSPGTALGISIFGMLDGEFETVTTVNNPGFVPTVIYNATSIDISFQAAAVASITSDPNPSIYGETVTFTVTVSGPGGTPTGDVTFYQVTDASTTELGTGSLTGGVATFTSNSLVVGSHTFTAIYGGDDTYFGTTTDTGYEQVVDQATTTVTVTSAPNPSAETQMVTFTATVVGQFGGLATGDVTFYEGTTTLGTGTVVSGIATFTTSSLEGGVHTITAVYSGDDNFLGSTTAVGYEHDVSGHPDGTTTVVTATPSSPSQFLQMVTFTATVTPNTSGEPSGTVSFFDGTTFLGTGTLDVSYVATFTTGTLAVGAHAITAVYEGDGTNLSSTSAPLIYTVDKASTTTTITSAPNPAAYGQTVTFTATVTGAFGGTPTGDVTFLEGTVTLGSGTLDGGGVATFTTNTLTIGTHNIYAVYEGDDNFEASTATAVTQVVNPAAQETETIVTSSPNPSNSGATVTFTATVTADSGVPTGEVVFYDGTTVLGTVAISTPTPTSWTSLNDMNEARFAPGAATAGDGTVYVIGGQDGSFTSLDTVEMYDSTGGIWTAVASMTTARDSLAVVLGPDGKIYAIGGTADFSTPLDTVERYDPATDSWETVASMSTPRFGLTAVVAGGQIYAIGGNDGMDALTTVEVYNPDTNSWTTVASTNTAHFYGGAAVGPNGKIYVMGGFDEAFAITDVVEEYDIGTDTWTVVANMPTARYGLAVVTGIDGLIYAIGGNDGAFELDTVETYSTDDDTWDTATSMTTPRSGVAATVGGDGAIYVLGGTDTGFNLATAERLDFQSDALTFTIDSLSIGTHTITAVYSGDTNFLSSTSEEYFQVVVSGDQTPTTTSLTASEASVTYGTPVTFTATISPSSGPTGFVTFYEGTATIGSGAVDEFGIATYTTSAGQLKVGERTIIAVYDGDFDYEASTSNEFVVTVSTRVLTISATGGGKEYDGTTSATVSLTDDRVAGDDLANSYTTATFADKNVGTGKTVSVSGISTTGDDAGNYTFNTVASTTADITARVLTISATGGGKEYDGTTSATVSLTDDRVAGDDLTNSYTTATFADKNVGTGKTVSVGGISTTGDDAGNYTFNTVASTTADITARVLTISATGGGKEYDGTTSATVSLTDDRVAGDTLTNSYTTATFADKNVGTGKTVSVSGISTTGDDAGNYTFNTVASTTADITARTLTISAADGDKVYDGTTSATVTLTDDRVAGDSLTNSYTTATFADKNVGTGKTVSVGGISTTGDDAGNYTFNTVASTTADITARVLTISATGGGKEYDGTTSATVSLTDDRVAGDDLTNSYTTATFADKNVGTGKTVSVGGISTTGDDAGNYTFNTVASTTADITARTLTISATGGGKEYDGTTSATVSLTDDRVAGDDLTNSYTTATFADKNVGTGKTVSVSGISTTGDDAGNYTFNTVASTTADITPTEGTFETTTTITTTATGPTVFSQPITFTATVASTTPGVITGSVTFYEGTAELGSGSVSSGVATFTTNSLSVGSHAVTAVYSGDGSYEASSSIPHIVTVGIKRSLTATVTSSNTSTIFGEAVTFTATVAVVAPATGTPSGIVTFRDGNAVIGTALLDGSGVAVFTPTTLPNQVRTHTIRAVYGGDANQNLITSAILLQTVSKASTSTVVISNINPSAVGQVVTFTATVTSGSGSPTGKVTFRDGPVTLGTGTVNAATGRATLTRSNLTAGGHTITAVYAGNASFATSTSGSQVQTISTPTLASTVSVTSDIMPSYPGQTVTFTATVSGSGTPAGFVTFKNGNSVLGSSLLDGSSQAVFTTSKLATGTRTITVVYSGDGNFFAGTSAVYPQTVAKLTATTVLTFDNTPTVAGQPITLTATVSATPTPTGRVTFRDGNTNLGTAILDGSGVATLTTTALKAAGTHTLRAVYGGSTIHAVGTSAPVLQTVSKADTTVSVISNVSSSSFGQVVTFTATVTADAPSLGVPTGTVTFRNGTASLGTASVNATTGRATLTRSNLAVGDHTITVVYGGSTGYNGNTSGIAHFQTVTVGEETTTTIVGTMGFAASTSYPGQTITITATVTNSGIPAGTVTFKDGNTTLGTAALDGSGTAVLTKALSTKVGTHSLTAIYGVNTGYSGSTSAMFPHTVVKLDADSIVMESLRNPTSNQGGVQYAFFTATVEASPIGPLPAGSVTFMNGSSVLGKGTLKNGQATLQTFALKIAGTHTITAVYSNAVYDLITSAPMLHTVVDTNPSSPTSTTVVSDINPSAPGQTVTFTVTVSSPDAGLPSSVVVLRDGTKEIGRKWLNDNFDPITFTISNLATGTRSIRAVYGGNGQYLAVTSPVYLQTVTKGTTTALAFDNTPTVAGQPITLTAVVTSLTIGTPTGTVTFRNGGSTLGTAALDGSGTATLTTTALKVAGAHTIRAIYGGSTTFTKSTSTAVLQTVSKADTTVVVSANVNPSAFGQTVTFTATVTADALSLGAPTGTVTFKNGTATLGTGSVNATTGVATLTRSNLAIGTHSITAIYGGSTGYNSSTSAVPHLQSIKKASTTTITSSPSSVTANTAKTFTVTVSGTGGPPTGTVTFRDGGADVGTATLDGSGTGTFTFSFGTTGLHTLTAAYGGDTDFASSTGSFVLTVT